MRARFLNGAIMIGSVAVLLTPLVFGHELLYPFVVYRTYVWYAFVELLTLCILWQYGLSLFKQVWKSRVLRAITIFLLIKAVTDLVGINPHVSWFGDYERMMGFVIWVHWWLMIVVFSVTLNTALYLRVKNSETIQAAATQRLRFERLMLVTIIVGCIVTFYGLLQRFHPAFQIALADTRLFSTIGNAAVAAGFLLWPLFFSLYFLFAVTRSRYERVAALAGVFILGYGLYLTATRGAMLAGLLGLLVFFVFQLFTRSNRRRRLLYSVALGMIVLAPLIIWSSRNTEFVASKAPLRRLTSISVSDFTANSRLILWKTGFAAVRNRWLTGYGEQTINIVLDRYSRPELVEQWFDSSHNAFLDIIIAHGVLGFAGYFFMLYFVFRAIMRLRHSEPVMSAILFASCVAYLAQNFFLFDTLVTLVPFALILAYLVAKEQKDAALSSTSATHSPVKKICVVFVGLFLAVLFFYHLRALQALTQLTLGYRIVHSSGKIETALSAFDKALDKMYFGFGNAAGIIRDSALFVFLRPFAYNSAELARMREVLQVFHEKARQEDGEYSKYYVDEAKVYLQAGTPLQKEMLNRTVMLLTRALEISEGRVDARYALAEAYAKAGDYTQAKNVLSEVAKKFLSNAETAKKFLSEVEILEKRQNSVK